MKHSNNFSQVAALEKLLGICNNMGARYNPGNASITPAALGVLLEQAQQKTKVVTDAQSAYTLAANTRKEMFKELSTFVAQLVRSAIAHGTSAEHTRDLQLLKKKFFPTSKPRKPLASPKATTDGSTEERTKPAHYKTFEARIAHFASIVSIVESIPGFRPNEPDLSVDGLKSKLGALKASMSEVSKASNDLSTARIDRDEAYYGNQGIHNTSRLVKEYVRSSTGIRSQTSVALGKVNFKRKHI